MSVRVLSVLLALCLSVTAFAQDAERVLLRYQWNAGDEITWEVISETTATITMRDLTQDPPAENAMEMWMRSTMPLTLVVESVDADGNGTLSYRIGVMEMDMLQGGQQQYIVMDPEAGTMTVNGEEQELPEQMMPGMLGDMKLVLSPRGEMIDAQIPEGSPMAGMFGGMDMAQLMRMSQQSQVTFPEQPVSVGYSWGSSMASPFGDPDENQFDATMVLTLGGLPTVGGVQCARIDMVGAMDMAELPMTMTMGGGAGPMPEGIEMKMGPMHVSVAGSMMFNPAAGRVVSGDIDVLMDMDQHISGTAQAPDGTEQQVDQVIEIRDMLINTKLTAL